MEYEFPPHVKVSKECRDLLHKILVPDPAKRITVPEIQNHVWYKKDLPPGVAEMNDNLPPPGAGLQVCCTVMQLQASMYDRCQWLSAASLTAMACMLGPTHACVLLWVGKKPLFVQPLLCCCQLVFRNICSNLTPDA